MIMNEKEKQVIIAQLRRYVERRAGGTQGKASRMLGIGKSTISLILQGDPENGVSDEMWREVATKTRPAASSGWTLVETGAYREISQVMEDAQAEAGCTWIVADAGAGKSTTARHYSETHPNVHYVLCADMVRSEFVREMARAVGVKPGSGSIRSVLVQVAEQLTGEESPLLVFDEADKLSDGAFQYFVQIYNMLEDRCGMIFLSTGSIEDRMQRGLQYNKRGYAELSSRLGRRFFHTEPTTAQDVYAVAVGNGLSDESVIKEIIRDASAYDNDLRRVKKLVRSALL